MVANSCFDHLVQAKLSFLSFYNCQNEHHAAVLAPNRGAERSRPFRAGYGLSLLLLLLPLPAPANASQPQPATASHSQAQPAPASYQKYCLQRLHRATNVSTSCYMWQAPSFPLQFEVPQATSPNAIQMNRLRYDVGPWVGGN